MKPGPATSTLAIEASSGMWAATASAIFLGAQCASLADFMAMVEVHSP